MSAFREKVVWVTGADWDQVIVDNRAGAKPD